MSTSLEFEFSILRNKIPTLQDFEIMRFDFLLHRQSAEAQMNLHLCAFSKLNDG